MSKHMFGCGRGKVVPAVAAKIDTVLKGSGVDFDNPTLPDGARYWFSGPNRGHPFDHQLETSTYALLDNAGIKRPLLTTEDCEDCE